jgi:lysophospholipase L1-like esterase
MNNKISNVKIIKNYQINFYNQLGYRKIWQTQKECVEFDEDLIFKPKNGKCFFNNPEFFTELNFDSSGRVSGNNFDNNDKGIAVIGDSHAMGWGVNDNETFSSLLEKKINRRVYNLAVSGYATERELIRLEKSNLLSKIDTIIIQYCNNDYHENLASNNKKNRTDIKFDELLSEKMSFFKRFRKAIRYSLVIPFEVINEKKDKLDWSYHENGFNEVLKKYSFLKDKKIIVIYSNGIGFNFYNFPDGYSKQFSNMKYLNINYDDKDFFILDGHLNSLGHKKISDILYSNILEKKI